MLSNSKQSFLQLIRLSGLRKGFQELGRKQHLMLRGLREVEYPLGEFLDRSPQVLLAFYQSLRELKSVQILIHLFDLHDVMLDLFFL